MLVLALLGLMGPHRSTKTSSEDGYHVTLQYGSIIRSGQPVPLELTIQHDGGFEGPLTVVFDQDLFDRLDFQNWYPNPDSETGEGDTVSYEFTPPSGDTFRASLDARVAPGQFGGPKDYWVAMDSDGAEINRIDYRVWVMP